MTVVSDAAEPCIGGRNRRPALVPGADAIPTPPPGQFWADTLTALTDPSLDPLFWRAERLGSPSAWWQHVPFAHWVVCAAAPRVLVELGTHTGVSYAAFCQAVARAGNALPCRRHLARRPARRHLRPRDPRRAAPVPRRALRRLLDAAAMRVRRGARPPRGRVKPTCTSTGCTPTRQSATILKAGCQSCPSGRWCCSTTSTCAPATLGCGGCGRSFAGARLPRRSSSCTAMDSVCRRRR